MEGRSVFDWAKEYLTKGYSIIPIQAEGKKPVIKWQEYQTRKATLDEALHWFPKEVSIRDSHNLGIVTGRISGLTVVDIDFRHGGMDTAKRLGLSSGTVITGGGGFHRYYRFTDALPRNNAGQLPGLDIRSEGGYVLAPPSRTVGVYSLVAGEIPDHTDLPAMPTDLLNAILQSSRRIAEPKDFVNVSGKAGALTRTPIQFELGVPGSRNVSCALMAGRILRRYNPTYRNGLDVLRLWNLSSCKPPLDDDELINTFTSIWNKHNGKNQGSP